MSATYSDFLTAYKELEHVAPAEKKSGYKLLENYPPAGFYVYALIDPRNDSIFYIGKGISGRVLKHEERTRRGVLQNRAKVRRIQEIYAAGKEVTRRVLFVSETEEVALSVEDAAIHELRNSGLTNIIGGSAVLSPRVQALAEKLGEKVSAFRKAFATG